MKLICIKKFGRNLKMTQRSRAWCITKHLNWTIPKNCENPEEFHEGTFIHKSVLRGIGHSEDGPDIDLLEISLNQLFLKFDFKGLARPYAPYSYISIGLEVGEDTQRPHIHIYVEYKNARSFNTLKKIDETTHIEKRMGTAKQADDYVKKDGRSWDDGEMTLPQGKRTDLDACRELIVEDKCNMRDACMTVRSYQSIKTCQILLTYLEEERDWKPTVIWIWGKAGLGKSRLAHDYARLQENKMHTVATSPDFKWWDGYDKHEIVLIEDLREEDCRFNVLLKILDRYPYRVEYKGGTRQLLAKTMFVTSDESPRCCYPQQDEVKIKQLTRRIDHVIELQSEEEYQLLIDYNKGKKDWEWDLGNILLNSFLETEPN